MALKLRWNEPVKQPHNAKETATVPKDEICSAVKNFQTSYASYLSDESRTALLQQATALFETLVRARADLQFIIDSDVKPNQEYSARILRDVVDEQLDAFYELAKQDTELFNHIRKKLYERVWNEVTAKAITTVKKPNHCVRVELNHINEDKNNEFDTYEAKCQAFCEFMIVYSLEHTSRREPNLQPLIKHLEFFDPQPLPRVSRNTPIHDSTGGMFLDLGHDGRAGAQPDAAARARDKKDDSDSMAGSRQNSRRFDTLVGLSQATGASSSSDGTATTPLTEQQLEQYKTSHPEHYDLLIKLRAAIAEKRTRDAAELTIQISTAVSNDTDPVATALLAEVKSLSGSLSDDGQSMNADQIVAAMGEVNWDNFETMSHLTAASGQGDTNRSTPTLGHQVYEG